MSAYKEQLQRTRRYLQRIEQHDRPEDQYGDDMWSFFQNCWHLKDWIKNDLEISAAQRDGVENKVSHSAALMICADLANARKHFKLNKPRVGASHSHKNFVITPGEPSRIEYLINTGAGPKVDGLGLAHNCLAEWERILRELGLDT